MDTLRYTPGIASKAPHVVPVKPGVPYVPVRFGMVAGMQKHAERKLAQRFGDCASMAEVERVG